MNRRAIQDEFVEMSPSDEIVDEINEEAERNVERIKNWFRTSTESASSTYVLYCLLHSDGYLPDWDTVEEMESQTAILPFLPRVTHNQDGDPIETEDNPMSEGKVDRIPDSYKILARNLNRIFASAFYGLVENGDIDEMNFIHLLAITDNLSSDDWLFLMDLITAVFEGRYSEAVHLGVSRMESVTSTLLENTGQSVTAVDGTDIQQAGLGGLLKTIEENYSPEVGYYLRYRYTEKSGDNFRNRTNHGQLLYNECNFMTAMLLLFENFQIIVTVSSSEFDQKFGVRRFLLE